MNMRELLPAITEDDRQLLHYNPNTDDLVEWAQEYALKAMQAARSVPVVGDVVAWRWIRVSTGKADGVRFFDGFPSDSAIKTAANSHIPCAPQLLIVQPTTSITAAELERLRWCEAALVYARSVLPADKWADDTRRMIDAAIAGEREG